MLAIQVPEDTPFWSQRVTLDGREYLLRGEWNQRAGFWYLGVSDAEEDPIVAPRKAVADWDLLKGVTDSRRPPGALVCVDFSGAGADPGFRDFTGRVALVYFTEAEVGG